MGREGPGNQPLIMEHVTNEKLTELGRRLKFQTRRLELRQLARGCRIEPFIKKRMLIEYQSNSKTWREKRDW